MIYWRPCTKLLSHVAPLHPCFKNLWAYDSSQAHGSIRWKKARSSSFNCEGQLEGWYEHESTRSHCGKPNNDSIQEESWDEERGWGQMISFEPLDPAETEAIISRLFSCEINQSISISLPHPLSFPPPSFPSKFESRVIIYNGPTKRILTNLGSSPVILYSLHFSIDTRTHTGRRTIVYFCRALRKAPSALTNLWENIDIKLLSSFLYIKKLTQRG